MSGAVFCIGLVLLGRSSAALTVTEVHYVMGTYFRITIADSEPAQARTAMRRCFADARRLEEHFSRFDPNSELSRLNADAAGTVAVSTEMAALLRRALQLRTATHGAFDVSVGALTDLWRSAAQWPSPARIAAARRSSGGDALIVRGTTVSRRPGTLVDVDGIAKGWAVDRCVAQLRGAGIARALLSFGESSLYALGAPPETKGWQVVTRGIDPDQAVGTLTLRDQAVSVSAVFGHERHIGSRRIGHIVDPRSGLALTEPKVAVVVARSATDAEAVSKALLITSGESGDAGVVTGALLIRADGVQRFGGVDFTPFASAQPIAAAAEPLR